MKNQLNSRHSFIGNMSYFPYEERAKLDLKDRKILFELSINPRFSYSSIAKRVRLPRETVAYRIEQLRKRNILTGSVAAINPKAFGFRGYEVYLKLKNLSPDTKKGLLEYFIKHNRIRWVVECGGKWDMGIMVLAKDLEEFYNIITEIKSKTRDILSELFYLPTLNEEFTYYGFFLEGEQTIKERLMEKERADSSSFQKEFLNSKGRKNDKFSLDELDIRLIKEIETNAMMPIAEIARKLGVSHNTVVNRFRKLISDKVITSIFPMISISLLGLEWHQVFLNMEFADISKERSFVNYCINHPYIVYYLKFAGNYNYKISIFSKNTHHLHEILNDIRTAFSDDIVDYEPIIIFSQHKFSYLSQTESR